MGKILIWKYNYKKILFDILIKFVFVNFEKHLKNLKNNWIRNILKKNWKSEKYWTLKSGKNGNEKSR